MKKVCLLLWVVLAAMQLNATVNDFYVTAAGSDGDTGAFGHPWLTINHAASALSLGTNGTTVHVGDGSYGCVNTNRTATASQRIRYISDNPMGAKIICSSLYAWQNGQGSNTRTADYVDIIGFDIQGSTSTCEGISQYGAFVYIHGNYIHDVLGQNATTCGTQGGGGIVFRNNGNPATVAHDSVADGNIIDRIGKGDDGTIGDVCLTIHGIYMASPRQTATNNIISRACAWGIHMFHDTYQDAVSNNVVINNYHGGIIVSASDGFTNNNTTVNNNIVAHNGGEAPIEERWGSTGSNNTYANNVMYANVGGNTYFFANGSRTTSNTLSGSDAMFVSYNSSAKLGNFHLVSHLGGSTACAPGGLTSCVALSDFDGLSWAGSYDVGAYKFGGTTGGDTPPAPPTGLTATVT